jgi:hypothetical protein
MIQLKLKIGEICLEKQNFLLEKKIKSIIKLIIKDNLFDIGIEVKIKELK